MSNNSQQNMITQGTTLVGDVLSEGDFRVEGNIKGNIKTTGRIVVGKTGVVNGSLEGEDAAVEGVFIGKLKIYHQVKNKKKQHNLIIFSQIGLQMLMIILAGVFVGFKLDQIYPNQYKAFTILFSLLSVGFSIYFVIKQVSETTNQHFEKNKKK